MATDAPDLLGRSVPKLVAAIAILVIGWIVAAEIIANWSQKLPPSSANKPE
tara:strand:- start:25169 stop:25321 length:153 start_codon:yes stop_codon:yes gene_type:complete